MDTPRGRVRGNHRAGPRGRQHSSSHRGPPSNLRQADFRPTHMAKPLDRRTNQLATWLPPPPQTQTSVPGADPPSGNFHHQSNNSSPMNSATFQGQNPGFPNQLAASINSAIQTVLPRSQAAQPLPNNSANIPPFPGFAHPINNSYGISQPQMNSNFFFSPSNAFGVQFGGLSQPTQLQTYHPSGRSQHLNSFQPTYTPNLLPYSNEFNNMTPNHNYLGGHNSSTPVHYNAAQFSCYPQSFYPISHPLPPTHSVPGPRVHWPHVNQDFPRVTPEGYTISRTAVDESTFQSESHDKKGRFGGQRKNSGKERYRCEPCHQDFPSLPALVIHRNAHQKCSEPGCTYEGNSKAVETHEEDRHLRFKPGREPHSQSTRPDGPANATIQGLGFSLETEEQIAKWIEQRRKRWPTAKVIAEKAASRNTASGSSQAQNASAGPRDRISARGRGSNMGARSRDRFPSLRTDSNVVSNTPGEPPDTPLSRKRQRDAEDPVSQDDDGEEAALRACYLATQLQASCRAATLTGRGDEPKRHRSEGEVVDAVSDEDNGDVDPVKDAVSSKIATLLPNTSIPQDAADNLESHKATQRAMAESKEPPTADRKRQVTCKWWKMNKCKRGDSCVFAHPARHQSSTRPSATTTTSTQASSSQSITDSGLLSKLLKKDIQQDVTDLASVIAFLVDNDFLDNTELRIGQAHEERLIQPISPDFSSKQHTQSLMDGILLGINQSDDGQTDEDSDEVADSGNDDGGNSSDDDDDSTDDQVSAITPDSTVLDEALASKAACKAGSVEHVADKYVGSFDCVKNTAAHAEEVDQMLDHQAIDDCELNQEAVRG